MPPNGFKINLTSYLVSPKREGGGFRFYLFGQTLEANPVSIRSIRFRGFLFFHFEKKKRIRPGTTGFLFTRAKDSSVLRNTTEGLMRCWPNLKDISSQLKSEKEDDLKWACIKFSEKLRSYTTLRKANSITIDS